MDSQPVTVLAIDQGTSATKALLVDSAGGVVARGSAPVGRTTPVPGWVEQSADEIWNSVRTAVATCLDAASVPTRPEVVAVGLANQRESLLLWDRGTGEPLSPVVSWQDQRGAATCDAFAAAGHGPLVRGLTGLPLDPMFSATKATWLLDAIDPDRRQSRQGRICLGTIDSWLVSRLTGQHVIEAGNASRTQLLDIHTGTWSEPLLELFGVPARALGWVLPSTGPFRPVRGLPSLPDGTPLAAVLGDSHAALFAHAGWRPGVVKATYGTGSSVMALTEVMALTDRRAGATGETGACLTIAWDHGGPVYALEGNIRSSGDTLVWVGNLLGIPPGEVARLGEASASDGVHLVPGFSGLGAPWWDRAAAGLVSGLTVGTGAGQLARAALESIVFQVEDVVAAIEAATGRPAELLLADGGASANLFLMQLQADLGGRPVRRSRTSDLSALGVAHLAGCAIGLWSHEQLEGLERPGDDFVPTGTPEARFARLSGWHAAVARARRS